MTWPKLWTLFLIQVILRKFRDLCRVSEENNQQHVRPAVKSTPSSLIIGKIS